MTVLWVALGSAAGGVMRYLVSLAFGKVTGFPWSTFAVNAIGALAIGILSGWLARCSGGAAAIRAFAVIGFCGGFTTFSTFSNETFRMIGNGEFALAALYASASVVTGLAAVWLGYAVSR